MLHLGGPQLQKVFRSLEGTDEFPLILLEKPWYDKAVERLDAYFKPRRQDVLERHKLRNMKQGATERFAHFVLRLRQHLVDCGLEKYSSEVKQAVVNVGFRSAAAEFFVVTNGQRNLLGDTTSKQLGVLKVGNEVNQVKEKDMLVHIKMNPAITPCFQPLRRIPIPMESAVNQKLDELLKRDIIEAKKGPVTWVSPLVVAKKTNGDIRLCVDLRRVNQAVVRDRHPMPIIEDILMRIGKGKIWIVLDIKDAFFLLELDVETRDVMTFITHRGLYRFKRLPFGLVSAPEIFQRAMDEILADCEGCYWYLDDVMIEGSTDEEHDARLNKV
ncbi:uncharacterized protein K02A2.6-like [Topomyia yanbarensis]|uniref:uncharacterized protein K02A2.6-like n=1 Tax=Topomyia yanbarensis TaxID=2498891 RepID=UPI00273BED1D|nr:uncharacterized protein K02A2.6-like [Topomyia yanbarensis]